MFSPSRRLTCCLLTTITKAITISKLVLTHLGVRSACNNYVLLTSTPHRTEVSVWMKFLQKPYDSDAQATTSGNLHIQLTSNKDGALFARISRNSNTESTLKSKNRKSSKNIKRTKNKCTSKLEKRHSERYNSIPFYFSLEWILF